MANTRSGSPGFRRVRLGIAATCCLGLLGPLAACSPSMPGQVGAPTATPGQVALPRPEGGLVTRDRYAGHVEPDVAVNPRHPQDLLGACIFEVGSRIQRPGTFTSFDGARSWTDNGVLPLPAGYEMGADTTVAFDGSGTGYVVAFVSHGGGGYPSRVSRGGIFLWRTTDGGRSFSPPVRVYAGPGFQDHPWLATGQHSPASLFIAWTSPKGLEFAVFRDGAAAFSAPHLVIPGSAPADPVVTVAATGTVQIFYEELSRPGQPIRLFVVSSADDGRSFTSAELIGSATWPPSAGGGPKGNTNIPPPMLGAATDTGSDRSAVAISGWDPQAGHPIIYLWQSTDASGGWQGPGRPLSGSAAAATQVQPRMIYIKQRLYISYFATTRSGQITEQLVHQTAAGDFQPQPLNSAPFSAGGFIGDYQALASNGKTAYALWNDAESGRLEIVARTFSADQG